MLEASAAKSLRFHQFFLMGNFLLHNIKSIKMIWSH